MKTDGVNWQGDYVHALHLTAATVYIRIEQKKSVVVQKQEIEQKFEYKYIYSIYIHKPMNIL